VGLLASTSARAEPLSTKVLGWPATPVIPEEDPNATILERIFDESSSGPFMALDCLTIATNPRIGATVADAVGRLRASLLADHPGDGDDRNHPPPNGIFTPSTAASIRF
jgi:hypothetical protein